MDVFQGLQSMSLSSYLVLDLVFTGRRVVGILTSARTGPGLEGMAIAAARTLKHQEQAKAAGRTYDPAELDALVAADKHSFSFPYAEVKRARITGLVGSRALELRSGKREVYAYFPKAEIPRMTNLLDRFLNHARR